MSNRYRPALLYGQPKSPLQGPVAEITFETYRAARDPKAAVNPAVRRLFRKLGAYKVKPKRGSRGVIFRNQAFWWTRKGHYRPGGHEGARHPVQHQIWEHYHGRKMKPGEEIFFRDRDRHNFTRGNLQLMTKSQLHAKTVALGEVRQLTHEERSQIRQKWATKHSREQTATLLNLFNRKGNHANFGILQQIEKRNTRCDAVRR